MEHDIPDQADECGESAQTSAGEGSLNGSISILRHCCIIYILLCLYVIEHSYIYV